ncbi:hypothetical protein SLH49_03725 [Cognatiyoonia sp. IB215446]|uniref:hypothetical protein n=1 Tax=Cognatiyoonia sp. IB215446 TaxID=3097355 RepID=UPI002A0B4DAB|nr:hypothetical protein [Cognatiyoonia sp. IB215446]MDX8347087.1 hypothetical protein [Cognatiyoonia sp. IB215446]
MTKELLSNLSASQALGREFRIAGVIKRLDSGIARALDDQSGKCAANLLCGFRKKITVKIQRCFDVLCHF